MKKRSLPFETSTADALANVRVDRAALTHLKHGKPEEDNCEDVPSMQISYTIVNTHIALKSCCQILHQGASVNPSLQK